VKTISRPLLLRMTNIPDKFIEKINTHVLCSVSFILYEIMWKNIVQTGRPQMTIWLVHVAFWLPTAAKSPSEYVTLIAFARQKWLHERAPVLRSYVHCLSCHIFVFVRLWLVRLHRSFQLSNCLHSV
jgi:hypothetical protein